MRTMSRRAFALLWLLVACAVEPVAALATALGGQVNGGVTSALSPDGKFKVSLTRVPILHLDGPLEAELKMLRDIYVSWTFAAGAAGTGTFNVLQYDAFALNTLGGANMTVLYDDGKAEKRTDYNWVQFAYPTNWGAFDSKPRVDSGIIGSPFYDGLSVAKLPTTRTTPSVYVKSGEIWLDDKNYPQQSIQNPAGGGKLPAGDLILNDQPLCSYTCLKDDIASAVTFDTYLATFVAPTFNDRGQLTAKGSVTLLDGFSWGVQIECVKPAPRAAVGNGACACQECVIPEPDLRLSFGLFLAALLLPLGGVRIRPAATA